MKTFFVFIATIVMMIATALPANAHADEAFQGEDRAWVGEAHQQGGVFDKECDGRPVVMAIRWNDSEGNTLVTYKEDLNGCESGGNNGSLPPGSWSFRVCEYSETTAYCSNWKAV